MYSSEFDLPSTLIRYGFSQAFVFVFLNVSASIEMARTTTCLLSMQKYGGVHGGKSSFLMAILQNLLELDFLLG
jgi:hypothetical protein